MIYSQGPNANCGTNCPKGPSLQWRHAEFEHFENQQPTLVSKSAIETGIRRITASELLLAVERFGVPLDYFTDPFRLDGECLFSWRQTGVEPTRLSEYERTAGQWIGAYGILAAQIGRQAPLMRRALGLNRLSRFEGAMDAGERFVSELGLGLVPALRLAAAMEEELEILVLMVDAQEGISGAACRLPELDVVLIARREVAGRRIFDLAHELFHILTWDAMPPEHVEYASDFGGNRVEQLANNFAAAVLTPTIALESYDGWAQLAMEGLIAQLNHVADEPWATSSALRWRLVALRRLTKSKARAIPEAAIEVRVGHTEGDAVQEAHAVAHAVAALPAQPPLFVQVDEIVLDLLGGDLVGTAAVVTGEPGDGGEIGTLRVLGEAANGHVVDHALTQRSHGTSPLRCDRVRRHTGGRVRRCSWHRIPGNVRRSESNRAMTLKRGYTPVLRTIQRWRKTPYWRRARRPAAERGSVQGILCCRQT